MLVLLPTKDTLARCCCDASIMARARYSEDDDEGHVVTRYAACMRVCGRDVG